MNVALRYVQGPFVGQFRNGLSFFALKSLGDEELANEFFAELHLVLAPRLALLKAFGIKVARGIGRVDFVD